MLWLWGVSWLEIAVIHKCYDCIFIYLPEYLFLKLFNKCEQDVGVALSEHSKNRDVAIFLSITQCHTQSVITTLVSIVNCFS